jgi:hypothetical protein
MTKHLDEYTLLSNSHTTSTVQQCLYRSPLRSATYAVRVSSVHNRHSVRFTLVTFFSPREHEQRPRRGRADKNGQRPASEFRSSEASIRVIGAMLIGREEPQRITSCSSRPHWKSSAESSVGSQYRLVNHMESAATALPSWLRCHV